MRKSLVMYVNQTHVVQVLLPHLVKVCAGAPVPLGSWETPTKAVDQNASSTLTVQEILPALITNVLTPVLEPVAPMPPVLSSTIFQHVFVSQDMWAMPLKSVSKVSMTTLYNATRYSHHILHD